MILTLLTYALWEAGYRGLNPQNWVPGNHKGEGLQERNTRANVRGLALRSPQHRYVGSYGATKYLGYVVRTNATNG